MLDRRARALPARLGAPSGTTVPFLKVDACKNPPTHCHCVLRTSGHAKALGLRVYAGNFVIRCESAEAAERGETAKRAEQGHMEGARRWQGSVMGAALCIRASAEGTAQRHKCLLSSVWCLCTRIYCILGLKMREYAKFFSV